MASTLVRGLGVLAVVALPAATPAAVVLNPVAAPVPPGFSVAIQRFATAPAIAPIPGRDARIQQLKSAGDGSGRVFVNDTAGLIEVAGRDGGSPTVWFDVRAYVPGFTTATDAVQQGLLSFAFHPNFAGDPGRPGYGTFYVVDTETPSSGTPTHAAAGPVDHLNVVREFTVADPAAASATITASREVFSAAQPFNDHGPGTIGFNPTARPGEADYGKLYIGFGDGGRVSDPLGNAQDLASPLGKILRIDPADPDGAGLATFTVPADNPYVGRDGALPEIWASGLRNPQSFSWDAASGRMLIGDIGQAALEEVDLGQAGANYGWPFREGTFAHERYGESIFDTPANDGSYLDPIAQYDHEEIGRSGRYGLAAISSVLGYHGSVAALQDMAVLSDLVSGRVFYFPLSQIGSAQPAALTELFFTLDGAPVAFGDIEAPYGRADLRLGTDGDGELYFLFKATGDIFRLTAAVPEPATWLQLILGLALTGAVLRHRRSAPLAARRR